MTQLLFMHFQFTNHSSDTDSLQWYSIPCQCFLGEEGSCPGGLPFMQNVLLSGILSGLLLFISWSLGGVIASELL